MIYILYLLLLINFALQILYNMHMFQLNSYLLSKHIIWIKNNILKFVIQAFTLLFPILTCVKYNLITVLLSISLLIISLIYSFPKDIKISLKYTNRVKRMFFTEILIIILIITIYLPYNYILSKLIVLNILAPFLCILSNTINYPIEYLIKISYISKAKKKIKGMPNLTVIGITGSYGKTSVKKFLGELLSSSYEVLVTPKNYNTTMGVVKTILQDLTPLHQIFICEMGATHINDIKKICDIVNPTIGIITSIGPQHLESFKNIENIITTKFELADFIKKNNGIMFLNFDNEYISKNGNNFIGYTFGTNNDRLDYNCCNIESSENGVSFNLIYKNNNITKYQTKLIGKHNIVNLTAAIAVSNYFNVDKRKIACKTKELKNVEHRLEITTTNNLTILDNSYNSNPISAKCALNTLSEFRGTKIIITPGLVELGKYEKKYNFEFGENMCNICDYIFLVKSKQSKHILNGVLSKKYEKNKIFLINSVKDGINEIKKLNIDDKITILLENDLPDNYNL